MTERSESVSPWDGQPVQVEFVIFLVILFVIWAKMFYI